ncbi:hypothetical protein HAX54_051665 [Datura stramonium]|uniref:Uncharacterized protein n=1 Tax=Datura stramonium TaxID=4076 RepID=A0ABS8WRN7_DATST|nr:hypothetical protein [Datura stramonium]
MSVRRRENMEEFREASGSCRMVESTMAGKSEYEAGGGGGGERWGVGGNGECPERRRGVGGAARGGRSVSGEERVRGRGDW